MKNLDSNADGFTLLEVMVALALIGISMGILFQLIGQGVKSIAKTDHKSLALTIAQEKIDSAVLGLLGGPSYQGFDKILWEGKTEQGIEWKVTASPWTQDGQPTKEPAISATWLLFTADVRGITLNTLAVNPLKNEKR